MGAHHRPTIQAIAGPWADDAACRDASTQVFFAETPDDERQALALCRACPVQRACLRFAVERQQRHGVWGGTTERERRAMIRDRRRDEVA